MAQKTVNIPDLGDVRIQKRKGAKSIRLSVGHDGLVRVSIPAWTPYKVGVSFALSKLDWVLQQQVDKHPHAIADNQRIGKNHRVKFIEVIGSKASSRVTDTELVIRIPNGKNAHDSDIQKLLKQAAVRALKQEAKHLLPQKLDTFAKKHSFKYESVTIKHLKSRWGSCSVNHEITLNCFLMQLPWELIDYVLLHELVHTKIMAHGGVFWTELAKYVTDLPDKRKLIKKYNPTLITQL